MDPVIIALGGIYGVGKTTLAHQLSIDLDIRQRLGLGAIARTLRAFVPDHEVIKDWGNYESLDRERIKSKFLAESALVAQAIRGIVDCCYHTGESYIIDGVQLIPSLLPIDKIKLCIITVSNLDEYTLRFERPTVTRARHHDQATVHSAKVIEEVIFAEAQPFQIPIFDNLTHVSEISRRVIQHFGIQPRTSRALGRPQKGMHRVHRRGRTHVA